jgi:chemotaxis protein CheD
MAQVIEVPTAAYAIARAPESLMTIGVGSCVAICLYSPQFHAGALLHCMLSRAGQHVPNPFLYADTGISRILEELIKIGVTPTSLVAKLVGGAEMFPTLQTPGESGIGTRNIEETTKILQAIGIPVASSSLGGNRGKSLAFDLNTGIVTITGPFRQDSQSI